MTAIVPAPEEIVEVYVVRPELPAAWQHHGWGPRGHTFRACTFLSLPEAQAEGVTADSYNQRDESPRDGFARLWDQINGERGGASWAGNPWVWAIGFERVTEGA